jgi:DNA-binding transcriptional ArsR family regulator
MTPVAGTVTDKVVVATQERFVYHQSMNVDPDAAVSGIAAAIATPARARMLYCLIDGRARTSTELALVGAITPSTASIHLQRLKAQGLVTVVAQGRHRYYTLGGATVAATLESMCVLAGASFNAFVPNTPSPLRAARTCYDHIAGTLGVSLYDCLIASGWLAVRSRGGVDLMPAGATAFASLGIDVNATRALRRRFAYACLDWSERRPHLGGALGAALLDVALKKRWAAHDRHSRALAITTPGRRELRSRFGCHL